MVVDGDALVRIVEHKDASAEERKIGLVLCRHAGGQGRDSRSSFCAKSGTSNAQGEFYLTDVIAIARGRGLECAVVEGPESEMLGVNSRAQLAEAEAAFQARRRRELMEQGVTLRSRPRPCSSPPTR